MKRSNSEASYNLGGGAEKSLTYPIYRYLLYFKMITRIRLFFTFNTDVKRGFVAGNNHYGSGSRQLRIRNGNEPDATGLSMKIINF